MVDVAATWGIMDAEEEEDRALPLQEEFIAASPNSRIRWSKQRIVVRYPSEKFLLREPEEPTIITDENDFGGEADSGEVVLNVDNDQKETENTQTEEENTQENVVEKADITPQTIVPNGILKASTNSQSLTSQPLGRTWSQRVVVQRYIPKFKQPAPQPEEADNGEDEEESEEEEVDEDGYDSVVEDDDAEEQDDPIKKIAEEITTTRNQKLHTLHDPKASEQDDMLKTISQIKDQLRDEVEKAEQASKAAAEAAQQAEESNQQLASKMASMRSFLAVLCGCGVRIVGMLVASKLFDSTATRMKTPTRSLLPLHLLPSILQPLSPHLITAASVSITHTLLRHFLPRLGWSWLASIDGTVGGLVSMCAAALGGARGGRVLGSAMAAGCIVGIIASSYGARCTKQQQTTTRQHDQHYSGE